MMMRHTFLFTHIHYPIGAAPQELTRALGGTISSLPSQQRPPYHVSSPLSPSSLSFAVLLFISDCFYSRTATTSEESSSLLLHQNLVDWVVSKGGSFHAKQEYRRVEPNDPYSPFGMFATDRIEMGQVLYTVPWECILTAGTDQLIQSLHCDTIRLLISELQKENDSDYAPYVKYLQSLPQGQVPSAWSDAGKDVLELISGHEQFPPYEPVLWLDKDWKNECKGRANDTFGQHAAMLSLSKGEDDMMIPLLDMYNHANGRYTNADGVLKHSKYHQLIATRTIEKGEQISISRNKCRDCDDRTYLWYSGIVTRLWHCRTFATKLLLYMVGLWLYCGYKARRRRRGASCSGCIIKNLPTTISPIFNHNISDCCKWCNPNYNNWPRTNPYLLVNGMS